MSARTKAEQSLEDIYAEIPAIPDCDGRCAAACGPIAMFKGEWKRVVRAAGGRVPKPRSRLACPLLSPTGKCTVYSVRPYICRVWGATEELRCPNGCEPERWLTTEEARDIFKRIEAIAGPETAGPLGSVAELWDGIALEARRARRLLLEQAGDEAEMKHLLEGSEEFIQQALRHQRMTTREDT